MTTLKILMMMIMMNDSYRSKNNEHSIPYSVQYMNYSVGSI